MLSEPKKGNLKVLPVLSVFIWFKKIVLPFCCFGLQNSVLGSYTFCMGVWVPREFDPVVYFIVQSHV